MAALLLKENCTVTIVHSKTKDIPAICKQADIVVAAVGCPQMLNEAYFNENSVVIDVGINRIQVNGENKLVGDVDFDAVAGKVKAITPVPGGVGPMTIAYLMKNTIAAARQQIQS